MLESAHNLLQAAQFGGYAIGAFNVYNLEGVRAVVGAAEQLHVPAMLQVHPAALAHGGAALVALCVAAAQAAAVPIAVHLDHSSSPTAIRAALDSGITSIMADGSHLPFADNLLFTQAMVELAHARGAAVEAELGRLSGSEDGLSVSAYEALQTDPREAASFVAQTGIDALAICIGNVHGPYRTAPQLDFERLIAIQRATAVPLVLHGASGLPAAQVRQAIGLGVCKLNVNTELRIAYLATLHHAFTDNPAIDVLPLMQRATQAMQAVVMEKLQLFS